ncbi:hypothetical protein AURDEDRAFT_176672 [Auricularia subglabra TFB-10046 SS5]|uniref:PAH2 domain-containing protein n=1 Tax=Auricularia subglabra (strain TFB-10046 / SS5) TaxID=717982 RepID=J0CV51_AURST|nr:hypothetical protein AURDEDRAFT_176672 [Auricularia subglabra TFB-10046 SS5]
MLCRFPVDLKVRDVRSKLEVNCESHETENVDQSSGATAGISPLGDPGHVTSLDHDRPSFEDALRYLVDAKRQLCCDPSIYEEFVQILREYKADVLDTGDVIERVWQIFDPYPDLKEGFRKFLPRGCPVDIAMHDMHDIYPPNDAYSTSYSQMLVQKLTPLSGIARGLAPETQVPFDSALAFVNMLKSEDPVMYEAFHATLSECATAHDEGRMLKH